MELYIAYDLITTNPAYVLAASQGVALRQMIETTITTTDIDAIISASIT